MTVDILCRVVDNLGDIGFVYRLARALSELPDAPRLRLIVDDLAAFASLCPGVDSSLGFQRVGEWDVARWDAPGPDAVREFSARRPRVVLECYACGRPDWFEEILFDEADTEPRNIVNLEYLTAEPWARDFHRLPSLTRSPLVRKSVFMPGFESGTGGLLIDRGFEALLDAAVSASGRLELRRAVIDSLGLVPGSLVAASLAPASKVPASLAPANIAPASFAPSSFAPASFAPANIAPANIAPANLVAASITPASITPASFAPANIAPANFAPASITPASKVPASITPASLAPASITPASLAPASKVPASLAPANIAPASFAPSSFAPSNIVPASITPASITPADAYWVVVFSYERDYRAIVADLAHFAGDRPLVAFVAAGRSSASFFDAWQAAGEPFPAVRLPLLPQAEWDRLLVAADFAIVRGEESFARACLAGKPFLWQCYPFADSSESDETGEGGADARGHLPKVHAFLDLLRKRLNPEDFVQYERLTLAFNDAGGELCSPAGNKAPAGNPTPAANQLPAASLAPAANQPPGDLLAVLRSSALKTAFSAFSGDLRNLGNLAVNLMTFLRDLG